MNRRIGIPSIGGKCTQDDWSVTQPIMSIKPLEIDRVRYDAWLASIQRAKILGKTNLKVRGESK